MNIRKIKNILGNFLVDPNQVVEMPIPNWNYIPSEHYPRRTGRSVRMLIAAMGVLLEGNDVIVICGNRGQADFMKRQMRDMLHACGVMQGASVTQDMIKLELWQGLKSIKFTTSTPHRDRYRGIAVDNIPEVFYDHYYTECMCRR